MFKYCTFAFLFFIVITSSAQEITATQKLPDAAMPGGNYTVEITINKSGVSGFIKFFQGVPNGCTAKEVESKGGSFSFADGGAKIIWITPPAEDQFTISYEVSIPADVTGTKNINGKVAYLYNSERKIYDLETKTIKIGNGPETSSAETVLVTSSDHTIVTSSPLTAKEDEAPSTTIVEPVAPVATTPAAPVVEKTSIVSAPEVTKKEEEKIQPPTPAEPVKEEKKPSYTLVTSETPIKKEEKKVAPVSPPIKSSIPVTAIPSSAGKTFRVQVGAFNSTPTLKGVPQSSKVVLDNGMTKYFSGNFKTYEEAAQRKRELIEKGFQGAFIVSFENGKIVK